MVRNIMSNEVALKLLEAVLNDCVSEHITVELRSMHLGKNTQYERRTWRQTQLDEYMDLSDEVPEYKGGTVAYTLNKLYLSKPSDVLHLYDILKKDLKSV